jgi:hypothetical protein
MRLVRQHKYFAPLSKSLARINKSRRWAEATKSADGGAAPGNRDRRARRAELRRALAWIIEEKERTAMQSVEDRMPPHPRGTVEMFRARGHTVTVRQSRGGSLRYTLDGERERTALALSDRWRRLYEGYTATTPSSLRTTTSNRI